MMKFIPRFVRRSTYEAALAANDMLFEQYQKSREELQQCRALNTSLIKRLNTIRSALTTVDLVSDSKPDVS